MRQKARSTESIIWYFIAMTQMHNDFLICCFASSLHHHPCASEGESMSASWTTLPPSFGDRRESLQECCPDYPAVGHTVFGSALSGGVHDRNMTQGHESQLEMMCLSSVNVMMLRPCCSESSSQLPNLRAVLHVPAAMCNAALSVLEM